MLGLKRETVALHPHDPEWIELFEQTRRELRALIGHLVSDIEHVGATAVPGMIAKPILDIAVAVDNADNIARIISILTGHGYDYRGDAGADGGHLLVKGPVPDIRTHHVHIVQTNDIQWKNYLRFRDILKSDPVVADTYTALKIELAERFAENRKAYTAGKRAFIEETIGSTGTTGTIGTAGTN